ncbi:hypothetical protein HPB50_018588 [Hyalomma asiaticum]|uniref:Uncharacterized protein n=1 Tax=Hyalomma asiaticum TaxID=266040 RepID=A0ACB7SGH4_HYAAI|nr:hypothetical protein HPB50_018588 [Hyalomma asiaticum]
MHHMREMLVREHELVSRENERLIKTLDALEKTSIHRPPEKKPPESAKLQARAKVPKNSPAANRTTESIKLSPTVRKIGRSLNDVGGSPPVERRNSWGTSGIPRLRHKLVTALAPKLRRTASNRVTPADASSQGTRWKEGQTSRRLSSSGSFRTPNVTAPPRPEKFSMVQRCQPLGRKRMAGNEEDPRSSCLEQLRTCVELKVHSTMTSSNKTNPTTRYRS